MESCSRVHKVVEVLDHDPAVIGSQRNRHLGVMRRCRGQLAAADGDPAIGRVDGAACTPIQRGGMGPWRSSSTWPDIAGPRQVRQHLRQSLIVSCRSSRLGSFACSSGPCGGIAPACARRFGFAAFGCRRRLLPRFGIAVASREMCSTRWPSIVRAISVSCSPAGPDGSRQTRKRLARTSPRSEAVPAPLQPHSRHSLPYQPADARSRPSRSSERRTRPWL